MPDKVIQDLLKKAEQGNAYAQNELGFRYYMGTDGVERDYQKAVEWFRKAAEQGNAAGQYNLGWCYQKGKGVEQDDQKAVEWYTKAAEQGEAAGQNNLGWCYQEGKGVEQDYQKAVEWYTKAAEQGEVAGQNNLGWCYQEGKGVEQDYKKAVEWYSKSAEQGNAAGQTNLGWRYQEGKGVEQDYQKAVEWFCKAAEQGDAAGQNHLGWCYKNGKGVEQDVQKAIKLHRKAAEQGQRVAQSNLGWCYNNGEGVELDYKKAVEWYRKAAEQDCVAAQYNLGWCYYHGKGVEQDYQKAVEWFNKAASQKHAIAYDYLAICYEKGLGVNQDLQKAKELWKKAEEQSDAMEYVLSYSYLEGVELRIGEGLAKIERESKNIVLNFDVYADVIADIFQKAGESDKRNNDFSFALFGKWGTGKTVLMNKIAERLEKEQYLPVMVNCWKYKELPALWANLYEEILGKIKSQNKWYRRINILSETKIDLKTLITHLIFVLTFFLLPANNQIKTQYTVPLLLLYYTYGDKVIYNTSRLCYDYIMNLFNFSSHSKLLGTQYNILQDIKKLLLACTHSNKFRWMNHIIFLSWINFLFFTIIEIGSYKVIKYLGDDAFDNCLEFIFCTHYHSSKIISIIILVLPLFYFLIFTLLKNVKYKKVLLIFDNLDRCPGNEMLDIIEHIVQLLDDPEIKKHIQIAMLIEEENLRVAIAKKYLDAISTWKYQYQKPADENYKHYKELYSHIVNENIEKFFICTFRLNELIDKDYDTIVKNYANEMGGINKKDEKITFINTEGPIQLNQNVNTRLRGNVNTIQGGNVNTRLRGNVNTRLRGNVNTIQGGNVNTIQGGNVNTIQGDDVNTIQGGDLNSRQDKNKKQSPMTWEEEELEVLISYLKQETESKTPRHVRSMMYKYLIARQLIHRFNLMYNFLPQVILDKFKEFYAKRAKMANENEDNVIVNVKAEKENGDDNKKLSALDKIINMVA